MRYLGGKFRFARRIAAAIDPHRRGLPIWDAFCGGLSVAGALGGEVHASDTHAALINLYRAVQDGWMPPAEVSREEYESAKLLPDTNPLKAFCGFGCSFGGRYFAAYAHGRDNGTGSYSTMCGSARNSLLKLVPRIASFAVLDFFAVDPRPGRALYLDPPYRGTAGYGGIFNHDAFEARALQWAALCPVFVSEYEFPYGREIWSAGKPNGSACFANRTERLFLVEV